MAATTVTAGRRRQAGGDISLGWTPGRDVRRHYYWRQLRDTKGSAVVESMTPFGLTRYARTCGWSLARAHARSGDPIAIAAHLGGSDEFDRAVADFAERYADRTERDGQDLEAAIRSGRLPAAEGI